MLLGWEQISTGLDNIYETVSKQAIEDWRFYVIAIVFFCLLVSLYFYLYPNHRERVTQNYIIKTFFLILLLSTIALFLFDLFKPTSINPNNTSEIVLVMLKQIPTNQRFYVIIVALVVSWLSWRFLLHEKLRKELMSKQAQASRNGLMTRDWWAYRGFRERALSLRTRAGLVLGGVFTLLFGGIYFILFIVPEVEQSKKLTVQQQIKRANFRENFQDELKAMVEGRYWFKTLDGGSESPQLGLALQLARGEGLFTHIPSYGVDHRTGIAAASDKMFLLHRDGSVFATGDSGQTWYPASYKGNTKLKPKEVVRSRALLSGRARGLILGNKGSVLLTEDGGKSWIRKDEGY